MKSKLYAALAASLAVACAGDLVNAPAAYDGGPVASLVSTTRMGDRIRTSGTANIRSTAYVTGSLLGTQPANARGTVIGGPVTDTRGDKLKRWRIDFDTGPDGWAADPYIVNLAGVATVTVSPQSTPLAPGATVQLAAALADSLGASLNGEPVSWGSSNIAVATVSATGLVTSVAAGTATITATSGKAAGSAAITPMAGSKFAYGARVRAWPEPANIRATAAGSGTLVGQQPLGSAGTVIGGPIVDVAGDRLTRWKVDFDSGADGWAAESYLGTLPVVTQVVLTPARDTIIVGASRTFTAVAKDSAGTTVSGMPVTWSSRDTLIAKVAISGVATAVAAGATYIIATSGGRSDSAQLSVIPVPVASVAVTPAAGALTTPATLQLSASALDSIGQPLAGRPIAWSSSTPSIAIVSSTGLVTGVTAGVATIVASSGGKSGQASITVTVPAVVHAGYYAAPGGLATNNGSYGSPWDLRTALAGGNGRVQPGDTIWMRGGTYTGTFRSTVAGAAGRPVVVRQYPGERAIIDAATSASTPSVFYVGGAYTVFWGFEITNSNPVRSTTSTSSNARPNVIVNYADHTRYVNLVVHDGGVAFYNEPQYSDVEVIGSIFYNNGWQGPDRGHGHALYLKSMTGPIVARDNVMFNQFGYGVHAYTNAGSGRLINILLEGNVAFNNGTQATGGGSANILVGGADYADQDVLRDNYTFFSPGITSTNVKLGYGTLMNGSVQASGNYFAGGGTVFELGFWASPSVSGNTFINTAGTLARLLDPAAPPNLLSGNVSLTSTPSSPKVVVRPNTWEAGRAMVVVYNWSGQGSVSADLSSVLSAGDRYEVRSVQDLYGAPVASGSGTSVMIPMQNRQAPTPIGGTNRAPTVGQNFDVFIVTRK